MRQIHVHVDRAAAGAVLRVAEAHNAYAAVAVDTEQRDGSRGAMVLLQLDNDRVGAFMHEVEQHVGDAEFVIFPRGTLPVRTPLSSLHDQAREVSHLSTVEIVVSALQSIGSWRGMLLYALFSGLVAAYGVIFDVGYLLVAAMLVAPMGAPTMVAAVGVALGDMRMLRRGAARFVVAVVVLTAAAWLLGTAQGIATPTATMELVSSLSIWTVMLAVVGGAAGAQALVQSDRDSLVTATATGFLVAVSLSPPAAVLGLGLALGRWDYVAPMAFVILLTFAGVLLGGWASLTLFSMRPGDMSVERGSARRRTVLVAATALVLLALVGWQSTRGPTFLEADRASQAAELTRAAVRSTPGVTLLHASADFTRTHAAPDSLPRLLVRVLAARTAGETPLDSLTEAVRASVATRLTRLDNITPFIHVSILPQD